MYNPPPPAVDNTPPLAIFTLHLSIVFNIWENLALYGDRSNLYNPAPASFEVTWKATGDDGSEGIATSFDLRYSTELITEENWAAATQVPGEPSPGPPGTLHLMTVTVPELDTLYHFAIRSSDEAGNISTILFNNIITSVGPQICGQANWTGHYSVSGPVNPSFTGVTLSADRGGEIFTGDTVAISADVTDRSGNGVTEVTAWMGTDHMTVDTEPYQGTVVSFALISGTDISGTWEGTLTVPDDTLCYSFQIAILAKTASEQYRIVLSLGGSTPSCTAGSRRYYGDNCIIVGTFVWE